MKRRTRVGIADIGTNSVKFLIAAVLPGGDIEQLYFGRRTTRIGRALRSSGRIDAGTLETTASALKGFARLAERRRCEHLFAFSTYALRRATNAGDAIRHLERALGASIRILGGREEARLAYESARHALELKKRHTLLVDLGGGSTEVVFARARRIVSARSIDLGALHLTERFVRGDPIGTDALRRMSRYVARRASAALVRAGAAGIEPASLDLVGSGGTVGSAQRMAAAAERTARARAARPGPALRRRDLQDLLGRCAALPLRARKRMAGLDPERADIMPAGLVVLLGFMKAARKRVLLPNRGGVREGALIHLARNGFRWRR